MRTLIQNGPVITPARVLPTGGVLIEDGKILEILDRPITDIPPGTQVIDAAGRTISPGFVDIHVHGGGGHSVMWSTPEKINAMCDAHSRFGTTSILPSTVAASIDDTVEAIDNVKAAAENPTSADILGIHLEGPFFSQAQRGAQAAGYIINPTPETVSRLLDRWDGVRMMGVAPEIPRGLALGRELVRRGIVASIAHSDASFEEVELAIEHGFTDVTHLYSGCSHVHRRDAYRYAGVVEAGLYFDSLNAQVIADGKHLPASLLKLIYKCKGPDKIALITDGLEPSAMSMPEGTTFTTPNGNTMILDDGVMKVPDFQSFAGSCANMARLVRNMMELAGVPMAEAVRMASQTPASVIGTTGKGRLAPGCDADLVLIDGDVNVSLTMVRGRVVYMV